MATYAIGDIQGCYQSLQKLLKKIDFNPRKDTLWLAGDLINRGSQSLETLLFLYEHRASVRCVLGNHDLHFLAVEAGTREATKKDTFKALLASPERKILSQWLRQQPLFYRDKSLGFAMVHAGVPGHWTLDETEDYAAEVSDCLQSKKAERFFSKMYGNTPSRWQHSLSGTKRLRFITNALTRMRYSYLDGALDMDCKLSPKQAPKNLRPWFELAHPEWEQEVVFGHWASLEGKCKADGIYALDTGCVWGGYLTAMRLEDKQKVRVKSRE